MRYLVGFILGFLLITSCKENKNSTAANRDSIINVSNNKTRLKKKKISDYFTGQHWRTKHADTSSYLCELTFHEEYAIYWYHGQCQYYYFTNKTSDTTVCLLWSYKTDCIIDMGFLEKPNGIKDFPKKGDEFATYTLINDSTLKVDYKYLKWVIKINEMERDSIYPMFFYLDKDAK